MKKQISAALAAVSVAAAIAGGIAAKTGFAADTPASGQIISVDGEWTIAQGETPVYGKKFVIPAATVKIDGKDAVAEAYVVTPEGKKRFGRRNHAFQGGQIHDSLHG